MKLQQLLLLVLLTTTSFLLLCPAVRTQTEKQPAASTIASFPDGSYEVVIDGKKFRAITPEQLWSWSELKRQYEIERKDLTLANQEIGKLRASLDQAKREAATARIDLKISQRNVATLTSDYQAEQKLRKQAESFIPSGKVNSFFSNPWVRLANEFGKPFLQSWMAAKWRR